MSRWTRCCLGFPFSLQPWYWPPYRERVFPFWLGRSSEASFSCTSPKTQCRSNVGLRTRDKIKTNKPCTNCKRRRNSCRRAFCPLERLQTNQTKTRSISCRSHISHENSLFRFILFFVFVTTSKALKSAYPATPFLVRCIFWTDNTGTCSFELLLFRKCLPLYMCISYGFGRYVWRTLYICRNEKNYTPTHGHNTYAHNGYRQKIFDVREGRKKRAYININV